jgi:hypothetical protein
MSSIVHPLSLCGSGARGCRICCSSRVHGRSLSCRHRAGAAVGRAKAPMSSSTDAHCWHVSSLVGVYVSIPRMGGRSDRCRLNCESCRRNDCGRLGCRRGFAHRSFASSCWCNVPTSNCEVRDAHGCGCVACAVTAEQHLARGESGDGDSRRGLGSGLACAAGLGCACVDPRTHMMFHPNRRLGRSEEGHGCQRPGRGDQRGPEAARMRSRPPTMLRLDGSLTHSHDSMSGTGMESGGPNMC